jgi:hypothetical protein
MKRYNNKVLTGVFLALLGVFLLIKLFYSSKSKSNISKEFASLDTASISEVKIYLKGKESSELRITRDETGWKIGTANSQAWTEPGIIQQLLMSLNKVRIDRLVASDKNSWNDLYVSDTLSTHFIISDKETVMADWHLGSPPTSESAYIRSDKEEKVYKLESNQMNSLVSKSFNDWRDKRLIKFDRDKITKIVFTYAADSSFTLVKNDSTWRMGHNEIRSSLVDNYLNNICSQKIFSFANDSLSVNRPDATVEFWAQNNSVGAIKGWKHKADWIVSSSYQFTNYFFITESTMRDEILLSRERLKNNQ